MKRSIWLIALLIATGLLAKAFNADLALSYLVYPFTFVETRFGPYLNPPPAPKATCPVGIAAHRGYSINGKYKQNSEESVRAAINASAKRIELDLTVLDDAVVIDHDADYLPPKAKLADYEAKFGKPFLLKDFLANYSQYFERIVFDIKTVYAAPGKDEALLREHNFHAGRDFFVGRHCPLLRALQRATAVPAGCESQGIIANGLMGLEVWSVDYKFIRKHQVLLNQWFTLRPVLRTFPSPNELRDYCELKPEIALVDSESMKFD